MIKYKDHILKTKLDELTIKEYEEICHILNNPKKQQIDKYIDVIIICGLRDEKDLSEITASELKEFLEEFGLEDANNYSPVFQFELNGREYKSHDENYTFLAKDLAHIQNSIAKNGDKYLLDMMATVYKDTSLSFREHHTPAHLKHKANLFSELPAYYIMPWLTMFTTYITGEFKQDNRDEIDEILKEIDEYNTAKKLD